MERYELFIGIANLDAIPHLKPTFIATQPLAVDLRLWCKECDKAVPRWGSEGRITPAELATSTDEHDRWHELADS